MIMSATTICNSFALNVHFIKHFIRPVTKGGGEGGARGAFTPPQAPKVRILILNSQVKECSRLN